MHIPRLSYTSLLSAFQRAPPVSSHIAWTPFLYRSLTSRLPLGRMHSLLYFHYCNPHHFHVSWLRLSAGYNTLSTPVGEVGFEPTHSMRTDLQSAATLQLRRSPLITPYGPTDKTCQIFSFPLEGNMLYRHLHQKVFRTGVYLCSTAYLHSLLLRQPRFLTSYSFRHYSVFSDLAHGQGITNQPIFPPTFGKGSPRHTHNTRPLSFNS